MIVKAKVPTFNEDQLLHVTPSSDTLVIDFINQLEIMTEIYKLHIETTQNPFEIFPWESLLSFGWTSSKLDGAFSKRLDKWIYANLKYKFSSDVISRLGSMVKGSTTKQVYHFDIVNKFNWEAGDFGDGASCLWGGRRKGKDFMSAASEFKAMRIFRQTKNNIFEKANLGKKIFYEDPEFVYSGSSRAWMWTHTIKVKETLTRIRETPVYVIFNAYGCSIKVFAKLLSSHLGYACKPIKLENKRNTSGQIYINGDGQLIGPESMIKDIEVIDFNQPI